MKKRCSNNIKTKSQYFPEILVVFIFAFAFDVVVVVAAIVIIIAVAFLLVCFISNDQFFVSAF